VAQFPWDPKPEPPQIPVSNPPTVSSNYTQINTPPVSQAQATFSIPLPPMQPTNDGSNGLHIKTEPGLETGLSLPSYGGGPLTAQQRAAQNLAATFGQRAAASINAIQNGVPQQSQQQNQQGQQQNQQQNTTQQQRQSSSAQRSPLTQAQYQQAMAMQAAQHRSQLQGQSGVNGAQTDGAGDTDSGTLGIMKRVNAQGQEVELGRIEIDHMVRRRIEAMGQSKEGGGLMLPLKERSTDARKKRKTTDSRAIAPAQSLETSTSNTLPPRYDGGGDDGDDKVKDEELDEDAINSELDDSDDGRNEEEDDDDSMGHIMLCMYDKVQRVKNKWFVPWHHVGAFY
jgi:transcription initiation factor TFIIA large subunit